ncbi:MAG: beta-propeller fold lactonase family protein [Chloroflexota bacterium]
MQTLRKQQLNHISVCLGMIFVLIWLVTPLSAAPISNNEDQATQHSAKSASFTIQVNTLEDEWSTDNATKAQSKCSLREALQATRQNSPQGNQGCGSTSIGSFDSFAFELIPGTYLLTRSEQLPNVTKEISIDGSHSVTINGGGNQGRRTGIFIVGSGGVLNLRRLKLQDGWRPFGGAIWLKGGSGFVKVTEVEFYHNVADNGAGNGDGGAVAVDAGTFVCLKSKFRENIARNAGGAISSGSVEVVADRCEFFRNHAGLRGGAYESTGGSQGTHPVILNSKFRENWVTQLDIPNTWPAQYQFTADVSGGGAIYNKGYMELKRTEFFKNYTQNSKGGGAIYNQGFMHLLDVGISDNKARPETPVPFTLGGAILNSDSLFMLRTSIHSNESSFGGAILNLQGGDLFVINSTVADNLANIGGGIQNGFSFEYNNQTLSNQGGTAHVWQSTIVRANDSHVESYNVGNVGNGSIYMANSITDSTCDGIIKSHGGNIFKGFCQRIPADANNDQTQTDVIVQSVADISLGGLTNNGGVNLSDAEFLSVKVGGSSPALDLALDDYCLDPVLSPYFITKDQVENQRPNGPKCDSGALELGTQPPEYYSEPGEAEGLFFPLTIINQVPSSTTDLFLQNKGGGVINWTMLLEHNPGGVFSLESGPLNGGLAHNQSTTLTLRCTPSRLGYHDGVLLIQTDLPDQPELRYPLTCAMRQDPQKPFAWRSAKPGPMSAGQAAPGAQTSAQIRIQNQGASPMSATVRWKTAFAKTLEFVAGIVSQRSATAQTQNALQDEFVVPPGETLNIDVACSPDEAGLSTNTLQIITNDPINPILDYHISCEGVAPSNPEQLTLGAFAGERGAQRMMGMALSPGGEQLLAGHWDNNELLVYETPSGHNTSLTLQTRYSTPSMNGISEIHYTSDGQQIYYTSYGGGGVVALEQDRHGTLTHVQTISRTTAYICGANPIKICHPNSMDGARALDISPDDQNLYVTGLNDDTLTVLSRHPDNGRLSFSQKFTGTIAGQPILDRPFGVLVSDDGRNVYVVGRNSDTLVVFRRHSSNGKLTYLTHYQDGVAGVDGLGEPIQMALSPDGRFLYVVSFGDGAIQIFERNLADGFLAPVEAVPVGDGPYHILISNDIDGERLLVALWTGDEIRSFARNRETGLLSPVEDQADLLMDGPVYLVSSVNDQDIYASLYDGQGVQHLQSLRHTPTIQNLFPVAVVKNQSDFTLTAYGTNFYPNSFILWNNMPQPTTFISEYQLTAEIPGSLVTESGSVDIQVHTSAPGGGNSPAAVLNILEPGTPLPPTVKSLNPPAIAYGSGPLDMIVLGVGFAPQSQAYLNGGAVPTTYINETALLIALSATDVNNAGSLVVTVVNDSNIVNRQAANETASPPLKFVVAAPNMPAQPAISGFQPASFQAGSEGQWLTVIGHNFSAQSGQQSVGYWNGVPRETFVADTNTLHMHLEAADLSQADEAVVTIITPSVPSSEPQTIAILASDQNATPQLDSIYVETSPSVQLLVSGQDFVTDAMVYLNGQPLPTTYVSPYLLTADVSDEVLEVGGLIQVANPGTDLSNGQILFKQPKFTDLLYLPMIRR